MEVIIKHGFMIGWLAFMVVCIVFSVAGLIRSAWKAGHGR